MKHRTIPFARKRRQLQHVSKLLCRAVEHGDFERWSDQKRCRLLSRWRRLYRVAGKYFAPVRLRRLLGAAAVFLGFALEVHQLQAQTFAPPQTNPFGLFAIGEEIFMPTLVDLDADGDLDVVVCAYGVSGGYFTPYFFENVGSAVEPAFGEFVEDPWGLDLANGHLLNLDFADMDGDGDLDAFAATDGFGYGGASHVVFFENQGTAQMPNFSAAQNDPFGMVLTGLPEGLKTLRLADVDGDGDQDLLLATIEYSNYYGSPYGGMYFFENTGTPNAPAFGAPLENTYGMSNPGVGDLEIAFFDFADMDGDGDEDLLCAVHSYDYSSYTYLNNLYFYENQSTAGNISFAEPVEDAFGVELDVLVDILALGDLDGDSDVDILSCHLDYLTYDLSFYFYENQAFVNQAPLSDTAAVAVFANNDYAFSLSDFPYSDADNDPIAGIRIESLIDQGMLSFQGNPVAVGLLIPADQLSDLVFRPEDDEFGDDYAHFSFSVFDGLDYSEVYVMTIHVQQNVGTQQLPLGAFAKLYPNPSDGAFRLVLKDWPSDGIAKVDLFDLQGQRVLSREGRIAAGSLEWSLEAKHLPEGKYLLRLSSAAGHCFFPVVVLKTGF